MVSARAVTESLRSEGVVATGARARLAPAPARAYAERQAAPSLHGGGTPGGDARLGQPGPAARSALLLCDREVGALAGEPAAVDEVVDDALAEWRR